MISFPVSALRYGDCRKPIEMAKDQSGTEKNQVRCICGAVNTIYMVGGGSFGQSYENKKDGTCGYISPFAGGIGGSGGDCGG